MRNGILTVAILLGVAIGAGSLLFAFGNSGGERPFDAGFNRNEALSNFSNEQALAILEGKVREICDGVHPNALRKELQLVRSSVETQGEDHWLFTVPTSDYLAAKVFPDGNISGTLTEFVSRECGGP